MAVHEMPSNGFNKKKVTGFIDEWMKVEEEASAKIGKIMAAAKTQKDNILQHAEDVGIKRTVMRNVIAEKKLRTKADAMRDDFAEATTDTEVVDQRDRVALAAGLPLFDSAEEAAAAADDKKKKAKPEKGVAESIVEAAAGDKAAADKTKH